MKTLAWPSSEPSARRTTRPLSRASESNHFRRDAVELVTLTRPPCTHVVDARSHRAPPGRGAPASDRCQDFANDSQSVAAGGAIGAGGANDHGRELHDCH